MLGFEDHSTCDQQYTTLNLTLNKEFMVAISGPVQMMKNDLVCTLDPMCTLVYSITPHNHCIIVDKKYIMCLDWNVLLTNKF